MPFNNSEDLTSSLNLFFSSSTSYSIFSSIPSSYNFLRYTTILFPILSDSILNINSEKIKKEEILTKIKDILKGKEPGKNYTIIEEDYTTLIKPSNSTFINFKECESILRSSYNISNSFFIILLI